MHFTCVKLYTFPQSACFSRASVILTKNGWGLQAGRPLLMPLVERRSYCTAQSVVCTPLQKESTNKLTISTDILLHLQEAKHYDTRMLAAYNLSWTIHKTSMIQLRECTRQMQQAVMSHFLFLLANLPPFFFDTPPASTARPRPEEL